MLRKTSPLTSDLATDKRTRNSAWRAQVLVEVHDSRTQLRWLRTPEGGRNDLDPEIAKAYADAAEDMLNRAHATALNSASLRGAISGANIQAASQYLEAAKINTVGERAEDVFLVTDRAHRPITDAAALDELREVLTRTLHRGEFLAEDFHLTPAA